MRRSAIRCCAALVVSACALSVSASAAEPAPISRVWIDDPIAGAVVQAGPVGVQVHGNDPSLPLQLFVDDALAASNAHPAADGRLSTAILTWTAVTGTHRLVAREAGLASAVTVVHVVPAAGGPSGGSQQPPSHGGAVTTPPPSNPASSPPPDPVSNPVSSPPGGPPSDLGGGQHLPPLSTVPPSTPHLSVVPSRPHLHFLPPAIIDVGADPTVINGGPCADVLPLSMAAHVNGATTVAAQLLDSDGDHYEATATNTGGLWTALLWPNQMPLELWGRDSDLYIEASGPGGTTRLFVHEVTVLVCQKPIH